EALEAARDAIEAFHREQLRPDIRHARDGVVVREVRRPVDRAGLYVPGGLARYPSTVLMTAVPAGVAGVPELALCAPPGKDGHITDEALAGARRAGGDRAARGG